VEDKILNVTLHKATPQMIKEGVVEPEPELGEQLRKLLLFTEKPDYGEIVRRATRIAELVYNAGYKKALIGGAGYLMPFLVKALKNYKIQPVFAFTRRVSEEQRLPDGTVRKVQYFKFEGFIEL